MAVGAGQSSTGSVKTELRENAVGLPGMLMQGIATIGPSFAILASFVFIVSFAGIVTPWAFLFGGVLLGLQALSAAQLAKVFPSAGGWYTWIARSFHPRAGFFAGVLFSVWLPPVAALTLSYLAKVVLEPGVKSEYGVDVPGDRPGGRRPARSAAGRRGHLRCRPGDCPGGGVGAYRVSRGSGRHGHSGAGRACRAPGEGRAGGRAGRARPDRLGGAAGEANPADDGAHLRGGVPRPRPQCPDGVALPGVPGARVAAAAQPSSTRCASANCRGAKRLRRCAPERRANSLPPRCASSALSRSQSSETEPRSSPFGEVAWRVGVDWVFERDRVTGSPGQPVTVRFWVV